MKWVRVIAVLVALALLSGCHALRSRSCAAPKNYQGAASVAPLKIPAGLDAPETASALRIPALNEPPAPPRDPHAPCLDEPPSFKVKKPAAPQA
jgi:uncharacterized lipoprotein